MQSPRESIEDRSRVGPSRLSPDGSATMYSQGDVNFDGIVNVLGDAFILVGNLGMNNAAP